MYSKKKESRRIIQMANVRCSKCGSLIGNVSAGSLVKCPRCGNVMKLAAASTAGGQQEAVAQPVTVAAVQDVRKGNNSALGIIALILSIFGCTFWISLILAIIDLCQRDGRSKICSIISLVICGMWMLLFIVAMVLK